MSYLNDLTDLDDSLNDYIYENGKDERNNVNKSYSNNDIWSNGKHHSPIFENQDWQNGFDTEKSGMTKLVSSEEDIISTSGSSSPKYVNGNKSVSTTEKISLKLSSTSIDSEMEMNDGFASNDVITVGQYPADDEAHNSPETCDMASMGEHWGNTEYETVLRTNYANVLANSNPRPVNPSIANNKNHRFCNINDSICSNCEKKVYNTELVTMNKRIYHKNCFKCTKCNGKLRLNEVGMIENKLFCTTHYKETFKHKGKCDAFKVDDVYECNELPPVEIAKNRIEKFRQLEAFTDVGLLRPKENNAVLRRNIPDELNVTPINKTEDLTSYTGDEMPTRGSVQVLLQHWSNIENVKKRELMWTIMESESIPKMNIMNFPSPIIIAPPNSAEKEQIKDVNDQGTEDQSELPVFQFRDHETYTQITAPIPFNPKINTGPSIQDRIEDLTLNHTRNYIEEIDQSDELPEEGITRNLVGFFQAMEGN